MKIIIDNKIPFIKSVLEPFMDVDYMAGNEVDKEVCEGADALMIRTRTKCNAKLLEGSSIKFIASATIGYDHIDTEYCGKSGIKWTNAPGCNSGSVLQWVMAALLYQAKKRKIDLTKRTLGVIGVGNIGAKIVNFAEHAGIPVLLNDPPRERMEGRCGFVSLNTILKECDIITFHVPLIKSGVDKTYHLVDKDFLSQLRPGTVLINSSRGEVINNTDLLGYMNNKLIQDVLLDVWENEPDINLQLLEKALVATPHIAGYSLDGKANGTAYAVQALSRHFGLPLEDWFPEVQDEKEQNRLIKINASFKSFQEIIQEISELSYPIGEDVRGLKEKPQRFESLRGNYPVRREPFNWQVELTNDSHNYKKKLARMGYEVL